MGPGDFCKWDLVLRLTRHPNHIDLIYDARDLSSLSYGIKLSTNYNEIWDKHRLEPTGLLYARSRGGGVSYYFISRFKINFK